MKEEIGGLVIQIRRDEEELKRVQECGNEVAKILRVMADCLDLDHRAYVEKFQRGDVFFAIHDDSDGVRLKGMGMIEGKGLPFRAPENVVEIMKRINELERSISDNKEQQETLVKRALTDS